jgi:hypothetical protein
MKTLGLISGRRSAAPPTRLRLRANEQSVSVDTKRSVARPRRRGAMLSSAGVNVLDDVGSSAVPQERAQENIDLSRFLIEPSFWGPLSRSVTLCDRHIEVSMSSPPVLCSVAADAFGNPPRRSHIEARKLSQGFEVWFFDERSCPDGQRLAQRESLYSARAFAQVMLDFGIERRLSGDVNLAEHTSWSAAVVSGEHGLSAHLLRLAYTTGSRYIY